ncbi:hypothetical protein NVP1161O_008 [Vibrio phage 1.161.O._10N.261.48.C5]|nr:hypothetical protein NVP1161O_008 [Vibrio phage 1.161.O._10N.261.48.C5]
MRDGQDYSTNTYTTDRKTLMVDTSQKLYIMKNAFGLYKIGISKNVEQRRKQLQNTSGVDIEVLETFTTVNITAYEVEQYLHEVFSEFRKNGEWFSKINIKVVKDYINQEVNKIPCKTVETKYPKLLCDPPFVDWKDQALGRVKELLDYWEIHGFRLADPFEVMRKLHPEKYFEYDYTDYEKLIKLLVTPHDLFRSVGYTKYNTLSEFKNDPEVKGLPETLQDFLSPSIQEDLDTYIKSLYSGESNLFEDLSEDGRDITFKGGKT